MTANSLPDNLLERILLEAAFDGASNPDLTQVQELGRMQLVSTHVRRVIRDSPRAWKSVRFPGGRDNLTPEKIMSMWDFLRHLTTHAHPTNLRLALRGDTVRFISQQLTLLPTLRSLYLELACTDIDCCDDLRLPGGLRDLVIRDDFLSSTGIRRLLESVAEKPQTYLTTLRMSVDSSNMPNPKGFIKGLHIGAPNLRELTLDIVDVNLRGMGMGMHDQSDAFQFKHLTKFVCEAEGCASAWDFMLSMPRLRSLKLEQTGFRAGVDHEDWSDTLRGLTELTKLSLSDVPINLASLRDMRTLFQLILSNEDTLETLDAMPALPSMCGLWLDGMDALGCIRGVSKLAGLQVLDINNNYDLITLRGISSLRSSLLHVSVTDCPHLCDVSDLKSMTALRHLQIVRHCPRPALFYDNENENLPTLRLPTGPYLTGLDKLWVDADAVIEFCNAGGKLQQLAHLMISRVHTQNEFDGFGQLLTNLARTPRLDLHTLNYRMQGTAPQGIDFMRRYPEAVAFLDKFPLLT